MNKLSPHRQQQLYYILADAVSSLLVWLCFLIFRWLIYEGRIFSMETVLLPAFDFYQPLLLYPLYCLIVYYLSGFYMRPFRKGYAREFAQTFVAAIPIALGAYFVIIIDDVIASGYNYFQYYQSLLVILMLQITIPYLCRLLVSIATGAHNHQLNTWHLQGNDLEKFLNNQPVVMPAGTERIIIELTDKHSEQDLYRAINKVYPLQKEIAFTARLYDMLLGSARLHDIEDQPMVTITDLPMSDAEMCIKRAFDVMISLLALIILLPLLAIISAAVAISSSGPILYCQERIGHYGMPFRILKFRTMEKDAEQGTPQLSQDNDPRITPVGRFLRKYRLDELPQLWNIIRGDMSIVGPRPEREYFINQIIEQAPYYCLIYKIRPGLTSWGPIRVGYTDTLEKMIQRLNFDIMYTENMSLTLDLKILIKTVKVILDGKGK